jgi:acyl-CoA:acyl-CoA alkyltransferase
MDAVRFENVAVVGLARVDAPEVMTSEAIEEALAPAMARAGFGKGLLYQLTGIRQRRLWPAHVQPSDAAAQAGLKALEDAGVAADGIGVLISTSVCKDFVEPSVASLAHHKIGLPSTCLNFDVSNACLGFLNGLQIVGDMIERGLIDYGMVVDGESSREVLEATIERLNRPETDPAQMRPQLATLTLGSGGAAMVLGRRSEHPEAPRIVGAVTRAASNHNDLCRGQRTWMRTDAAMLLVHGLALAEKTFEAAREFLGWTPDTIDHVAAHQVSAVHTARGAERLNLDINKFSKIFGEYGNVGPASIPIALSRLREEGALSSGDRIALMGIGSGLNVSMMEIKW